MTDTPGKDVQHSLVRFESAEVVFEALCRNKVTEFSLFIETRGFSTVRQSIVHDLAYYEKQFVALSITAG
ncbi:hypothetical protein [Rhizobium sp. BG4]|uniref:hypothetical protein n=1 Tax=Rhizobium sp. BG4 TaxID=2613770 RepID=UPI00193C9E54|nr:hypothetical protein [Rhizobium sp. BG4]QRM45850.1 hypothetical protein F2982_20720 [Rhizobium sp. BG4]